MGAAFLPAIGEALAAYGPVKAAGQAADGGNPLRGWLYDAGQIGGDKRNYPPYPGPVGTLRLFLTRRRIWAMWLISAALLMKAAVPAGYMPVVSNGSIAVVLCSGFGPERMAMAMPEMGDHHGKANHSDRNDMPCGFAGHAPAAIIAIDPVPLLVAIAAIVGTMFTMPVPWPILRIGYLRPHLRGPPAHA